MGQGEGALVRERGAGSGEWARVRKRGHGLGTMKVCENHHFKIWHFSMCSNIIESKTAWPISFKFCTIAHGTQCQVRGMK